MRKIKLDVEALAVESFVPDEDGQVFAHDSYLMDPSAESGCGPCATQNDQNTCAAGTCRETCRQSWCGLQTHPCHSPAPCM